MRIESTRRLIEHEHVRVSGKCSGYAYPLLLSTRNRVGARANDRVVALRPLHDVVMNAREKGRAFDRNVIEEPKEADVLRDRGVQQSWLLRDVGNSSMPVFAVELIGDRAVDAVVT